MTPPRAVRAIDLALLAMLLAVALAWPLASPPIGTRGEAREAMVVRDIVRNGHWALAWRHEVIASKPPLFHWLAAGAATLFGPRDAVIRLPSALGAWVLASATFMLGVALGGRSAGWLAVGALAGTWSFWTAAASARVDMVFAAAVATALVAFLLWYRHGGGGARTACYVAATCAVLAKGPAGAVLPVLVIVVFLARERDLRALWRLWSWPHAITAVAVIATWYWLAYRAGGREFLAVQVLHENVDRFAGRGGFHEHRPLKLVGAFAVGLLPWNLALIAGARRWRAGVREDVAGRFLHVWWITILVFFTIAVGRRNIYLLPLFPAVAMLAARTLAPHAGWRLACGIVVLDLAMLAGTQIEREHTVRRRSLAVFASEVRSHVDPGAPLDAAFRLSEDDRLVLEYLLDRPLPRRKFVCPNAGYFLAPLGGVGQHAQVIVSSRRKGTIVALVRCADTPVDDRGGGG